VIRCGPKFAVRVARIRKVRNSYKVSVENHEGKWSYVRSGVDKMRDMEPGSSVRVVSRPRTGRSGFDSR
jgi:hypothetical protein